MGDQPGKAAILLVDKDLCALISSRDSDHHVPKKGLWIAGTAHTGVFSSHPSKLKADVSAVWLQHIRETEFTERREPLTEYLMNQDSCDAPIVDPGHVRASQHPHPSPPYCQDRTGP